MSEVYQYPITAPGWWLDYYYYFTWMVSLLVIAVGWGVFFRYGKFSYGIDLGCIWKTSLMLALFVVTFGGPMYYNTRFDAYHSKDGDSIKLSGDKLLYLDRKGNQKQFLLKDITKIYQEEVTYNPPPRIFVVAGKASPKDSIAITTVLPEYRRFIDELSKAAGVEAKLK
ncbi:MAG: hypothetical protein HGB20_10795 [Chlorobiaceae bacterium]|nr:hypothetical protein [Chlorobiaceae bacterium]